MFESQLVRSRVAAARLFVVAFALAAGTARAQTQIHEFDGEAEFDFFGWALSDAGDVDADGHGDVVVGSLGYMLGGRARVFSGRTGEELHVFFVPDFADCSGAGDVDGDGVNDVTTSAPSKNVEGPWAGRVYVYSSATGALLWTHTGAPGSRLGIGIEAAGDVDADGIPDVIAGAPGEGKAYVFSGNDGRILYISAEPDSASGFGRKVADLGDVDGDGHADVLVGAPGAGEGAGAAYIYSGKDGSLLFTFVGERAGDAFGSAAGAWHDGPRGLIAIGAPNAGPTNGGRVYVYRSLNHEPAFVMEADEGSRQLGAMFVSVVGDVDADGTPDVYASDWAHGALGAFTGRIFVNSGATGEQLMVKTGEAAGDGFGIGVADAGDLDHDGYDDLIVGAWQHASQAPSGGKSYLYSGKTGDLMQVYTGVVPGETFGFDATGMGDIDGDGIADLLITSARSAINGTWTGRVFIIKGR